MMSVPVVVYVRPRAQSLTYRAYLQAWGGRSLFEWCLTRLAGCGGSETIVLAASADVRELGPFVGSAHRLVVTRHVNEVEALGDAGALLNAERFACVHIEHAFAPLTLLPAVVARNRERMEDATVVTGVPANVAALVINRESWRAVCEARGAVPVNLRHFCEQLARLPAGVVGGRAFS